MATEKFRSDLETIIGDNNDVLSPVEVKKWGKKLYGKSKKMVIKSLLSDISIDGKEKININKDLFNFFNFLSNSNIDVNKIISTKKVPANIINKFRQLVWVKKNSEKSLLIQSLAVFMNPDNVVFDKKDIINWNNDIWAMMKIYKTRCDYYQKRFPNANTIYNKKQIKKNVKQPEKYGWLDKEPLFIRNMITLWSSHKINMWIDNAFENKNFVRGLNKMKTEVYSWKWQPNVYKIKAAISRMRTYTRRSLFNGEYIRYLIWLTKFYPAANPFLLVSVCHTESKFNSFARNSISGANGAFQFMSNTAVDISKIFNWRLYFADPIVWKRNNAMKKKFKNIISILGVGRVSSWYIKNDPIISAASSMFYLDWRWRDRWNKSSFSHKDAIFWYNNSGEYVTTISDKYNKLV